MKRVLIPLGVLMAAGLLTAGLILMREKEEFPTPETPVPVVRTVAQDVREHRYIVRAQGVVQPRIEIQLSADVAGRIVSVAPEFAVGGFFEKGQVLVELDTRDHELALAKARATLAEASVRLQREEAEAEVARMEWQALRGGNNERTGGSVSTESGDEPSALLLRQPQVAEARATVASAEAGVRLAELDLERCTVRAPFAGRIREKQADVGQHVARYQVLGRAYSVEDAEIRLPLPLGDLEFIDLTLGHRGDAPVVNGPRVTLKASIGSRKVSWEGRIVRTEGEIDSRTRMLTAVVQVNDPYGAGATPGQPPLAVGMFVTAEIEGIEAGRVLLAPRSALRVDGSLLVVDEEMRLQFRKVRALRMEGDVAVMGADLPSGDRICISPLATPVPGMAVRLADERNGSGPVSVVTGTH